MVDTVDKGALAPDRKAVSRWEAVLANAARTAGNRRRHGALQADTVAANRLDCGLI